MAERENALKEGEREREEQASACHSLKMGTNDGERNDEYQWDGQNNHHKSCPLSLSISVTEGERGREDT